MKAYTEYLTFNTKKRRELIRITDTVKEAVRKSGVKEGLGSSNNQWRTGFGSVTGDILRRV
jgi:thiamine phosphate synthase YjbQ (UPF0047 family)